MALTSPPPIPPPRRLASRRANLPLLRPVNADELIASLAALEGSRDAGAADGVSGSRLVNGTEYAHGASADESKLRSTWKARKGGGATPLLAFADDPDEPGVLRVLGPQPDGPVRRLGADQLLALATQTVPMSKLAAQRLVAEEVDRLDAEQVAGLRVQGLGTNHLYETRLPRAARWADLTAAVEGASRTGWRELLTDLGYSIEALPGDGYLARADGEPVLVVFARADAGAFAKLDTSGRLPEGALVSVAREQGAPWGLLAAGARMRLLAADTEAAGATTRYLELDAGALDEGHRSLLGLLAPPSLAHGGMDDLLREASDYGRELREDLDRALRQDVLPRLALGFGAWARDDGLDLADDAARAELEAAILLLVFRALFLLYAESAGYLPMTNRTYAEKSLTRVSARAAEERDKADPEASALWDDLAALVRRMRTGHTAWDLPAYNGDLFAADEVAGAALLERASIPDAAFGPVLVALARDPGRPDEIGIDFSGLEIGHLGYVYEGLLSLRLSVADRDYRYDPARDRYAAPSDDEAPEVRAGELLWLTDEGGRKSGGVYYTRTELVRHLVRGAVRPAFERHLGEIRELAATDPESAARRMFEFYVLDPACGSAHFLVEVVDELADQIAALLGDLALPPVAKELERLRAGAGATFGAGIEDTALLKRLVLKRCVFGVDLSPLGTEIAKMSLWLGTFVPGLSLAYLDHNVQCGNALIGVARPEQVAPPEANGQAALFGNDIVEAIGEAAQAAARLRAIDDRTPDEFAASREANAELHAAAAGAKRVFDLWTAEALEPEALRGARNEVLLQGRGIIAGQDSLLADGAAARCDADHALHWPLAFAEVFARERPGFDAVVGNPPWDEINVDELGFYARYRPGLRGLGEAHRLREIEKLIGERPGLRQKLADEKAAKARLNGYLGSAAGYDGSPGNADLYKAFSQRYQSLLRDDGALGVVLPRSVFAAKGSTAFREWLLRQAPPRRIDFLLNRGRWAFDIHPQYSVALLTAERAIGDAEREFEVAGVAASAAEFVHQAEYPGVQVRERALGRLREVPLLANQRSADLLAKLRTASPFPLGAGRWRCFPNQGDFNETTDRKLWQDARSGRPLWKGESFDQFDPNGAEVRRCPESEAALKKAHKPRPGKDSLVAADSTVQERRDAVLREFDRARVAFRDVTNRTNSRTVIAALVPPHVFLTNKAPYLAFLDPDPRRQAAALGVLNSLPFDWEARRFVEINLNFFILEGLAVPELGDEDFDAVVRAAARLSTPDDRFADFAAATGVEVGPLDPDERDELRAEIDARVARAWGLTAGELEVVFADFTLDAVPEDYRQLVRDRLAALS